MRSAAAAEKSPHDGRFAPSPTGPLHLGNLRTALLAWLFARAAGARFIVRIEDLDAGRVQAGVESAQLADLAALGLDWDGVPERQSERGERYEAALEALSRAGLLYQCYCTRAEIREAASAPHGPRPEGAYPGTCRTLTAARRAAHEAAGRRPALRFAAAGERISFTDRLLGDHELELDDFVVRRGDGAVAYQLAVVVDDAAQSVGEVVRGRDLLDSTPRQLALARALGLPAPSFAHVPLVLAPDGSRLAKRHGAVTLAERAAHGQDGAAVRALLACSLGLAEPGETPSPDALVARLDAERLPRADAVWDEHAVTPLAPWRAAGTT